MIAKKNRKVDLERKRFAFFQIGLIVSGSLCLAAFEYSTVQFDKKVVQRLEEPSVFSSEDLFDPIYTQPKQQERSKTFRLDETITVTDKEIKEGKEVKVAEGVIVISPGDGEGLGNEFEPVDPTDPILPIAQFEPEFPGGLKAMASFINNNIDIPDHVVAMGAGGIVYVKFVVNKDGSIEQVEIDRGVSIELDDAARKVVSKMPKWKPGINAGKPVRVRFTLPIKLNFN